MQSRLICKKQEIENELKRGVRDPGRKQYLIARLLQIENGIRAMGFTEAEIARNDFSDGGKTVESKQYLVPPPSWITNKNS
jgi:hypothetical protein